MAQQQAAQQVAKLLGTVGRWGVVLGVGGSALQAALYTGARLSNSCIPELLLRTQALRPKSFHVMLDACLRSFRHVANARMTRQCFVAQCNAWWHLGSSRSFIRTQHLASTFIQQKVGYNFRGGIALLTLAACCVACQNACTCLVAAGLCWISSLSGRMCGSFHLLRVIPGLELPCKNARFGA